MLMYWFKHCRSFIFSISYLVKNYITYDGLPPDVFQRLHHLPDLIPVEANEGNYKTFHNVYGKETIEEFMP